MLCSLKTVKSKYVEKKYEVDDRVRYTWFGCVLWTDA